MPGAARQVLPARSRPSASLPRRGIELPLEKLFIPLRLVPEGDEPVELARALADSRSAVILGEAVVLLDGLDEVGNETARHTLATSIRIFQAEYPDCRFWVTSRIFGYTDNVRLPESFAHYRIAGSTMH